METVGCRWFTGWLPYAAAGVVLAAVYTAWVFTSRWNENRRIEQTSAAQRARFNREINELYGNGRLKIPSFYASPGWIRRGEKALLCLARSMPVRCLDPAVERVWPSAGRCFAIMPERSTRYTLTAEGAAGTVSGVFARSRVDLAIDQKQRPTPSVSW